MPDKETEEIKVAQKKWEEKNAEKFKSERKKEFVSTDGIPIKRVYTPADLKERNIDYLTELNFPGEYPFTRGIDSSMYRGQFYKIGQYAGPSSPEEGNKLFKELAAHGQEAFHIAYDLPTHIGIDSDDPRALADIGKTGIAINSLEDYEILFDGIDLAKYPCTLVCSSAVSVTLFAMHLLTAERQGHAQAEIGGVVQNDVLTGYGAWGMYCFPPEAAMRLSTDIAAYSVHYLPKMYAIDVCVNHWSQLGANRIQQIAIPLSNAIAFIEASLKKGLDIDDIGPKMHLLGETNITDFLAEIAKVRATRRLYSRIMKERFGAKNPASCMLRIHNVSCGGASLTRVPLEMNIARGAIATLAGALAGVQSVGGATYDEALGIPSAKASITAIQTRYLVAHECGVTETIDPLAGSYYVEYLTSELEERAAEFINKVDAMGGALEAIKSGFFQREVAREAYKTQQQLESGEIVKLGINLFPEEKGAAERRDYYKPNLKVLESQTAKLKALRRKRDNERVKRALDEIRRCAEKEESSDNNLVFPVLEAVKAYATVGEIRNALEDVFGEYRLPAII